MVMVVVEAAEGMVGVNKDLDGGNGMKGVVESLNSQAERLLKVVSTNGFINGYGKPQK